MLNKKRQKSAITRPTANRFVSIASQNNQSYLLSNNNANMMLNSSMSADLKYKKIRSGSGNVNGVEGPCFKMVKADR